MPRAMWWSAWLAVVAWSVDVVQADAPATQPVTTAPGALVLTEQARQVHRGGLLVDGHNDLPWKLRKKVGTALEQLDLRQVQPGLQTDIPRLRQGGVGGQFWVVYAPPESPQDGTARRIALEQFDLIHHMVQRYADDFELARTADDVERIHARGKIAALIGVEGGHMLENALDTLDEFYARGARYLGLTQTETIDWADSATDEPRSGGLSPFGESVVLRMNRLGMLVDIAHVSHDTMRDVLRVSQAPVISSHSGAYAVAAHPRNVPDDVLCEIARHGGVVMVVFFSGYIHPEGARSMAAYFETERALKQQYPRPEEFKAAWAAWNRAHPTPAGTVHTVVDHIDHIVRMAGIDHVGLGSDYEGVAKLPAQLEDVSGYPYITQELLNRGYSEVDIHKIMGGNLLRVLRRAEQVAREWHD
jgi:membrane dipeptidase